MSAKLPQLIKNPSLEPAEDFYRLRREGIGFIEQMASANWTDYNVHDPGITILEALCYAITELAYRAAWHVKDILSPATAPADPLPPYPNQAFFTAREILTVNPTTSEDLRRLLIDLQSVRNAWVICKECACDVSYFAWCDLEKDALILRYQAPADVSPAPKEVWALGLYEALLELEADPELGDLNDRKIELRSVFHDANGAHPIILELRFPDTALSGGERWDKFLDSGIAIVAKLTRFGKTKSFNVFTDLPTADERDAHIRENWRRIFYLSFEVETGTPGETIKIEHVTLRIFSDTAAKMATSAQALIDLLEFNQAGGLLWRYREKAKRARGSVKSAKAALQAHRNLDEDYCIVTTVGVEEVAVCADVEVKPDADIERVQAEIWFRIEQYFNPPIRFHSLQELRTAGRAVEDIFNGPALDNGFIDAKELEAAALRSMLRTSDIINLLMDIDGVTAVNQLVLTKYDAEGHVVAGAADPTWVDGQPVFDASKSGASWLLAISARHQPRLYLNLSRFLFYKNGLPFLPRMDEARDTLNELRGEAERPKDPSADKDLKIPKGRFRKPEEFYPVQYSLPQVYGLGPNGLPPGMPSLRKAQAKQLCGYLMVFEQVLGNALAQLAHTADLFSLDPTVARTYFVKTFSEATLRGFDTVAPGMTGTAIEAMIETPAEFQERRNRFLDHLLARFGEQFNEYALLLTNAVGDKVAQQRLIENKIAFLKRYPEISHDRGKAFDYTQAACVPGNDPGIKKRISLLLGYPDLTFTWTVGPPSGGDYPIDFKLADRNDISWLEGHLTVAASSGDDAERKAGRAIGRRILEQMIQPDAFAISTVGNRFRLTLQDESAAELARHPRLFTSRAEAEALRDELLAWSANERLIVVEHLLLRPKFPGDALFPACCEGTCTTCGDEDPYSFRLTFVMPGWTAQYTENLDLRRFADRTIRQETPSHLVAKICWVGNDGFVENLCDEIIGKVADLLIAEGLTAGGDAPGEEDACACANALYHAFSAAFETWYEDKMLDFIQADALKAMIGAEFEAKIKPADVTCTTVFADPLWAKVQAMMTERFVDIALHGWQFERFENAWCKWLEINAAIDWTEERLPDRIEAILKLHAAADQAEAVCTCAKEILAAYGTAFHAWLETNIAAGKAFKDFTPFAPPAVGPCSGMTLGADAKKAVADLLASRYGGYAEVSYRLWVVVSLLGQLRSTYPGATLHDCDDGSDHNPVRLDNTALGNYPLRAKLNP